VEGRAARHPAGGGHRVDRRVVPRRLDRGLVRRPACPAAARAALLRRPGSVTDLIGLAIGVPIYLWQRLRGPRAIPG
jgi:hypothetical protein